MSAPQRAQQGHLATPSVLMTTKAGTALEVEEGVKVARHGGVQSARLRPFLGIDLEKLPEGEENVDKVNTPRGSPEKAAEGCDMSQGRSAREGERASDEPKRMTDAPLEKEAASKSGRESEEGVNQSSQQKENTEGGGKEAVEGGVPKDPESPPEGGGAADPTEAPKQAEEDTAGDCKGGREESRKDGGKHTPEEGAIAESREERAPGSRGESEEKDVGKGDRGENSDAAGQQGSAERVGDKKGDRLRGGTRAEGSVMGAGPMEWRHDRPGDKHWHAGRERKSLEDPPKRKARDFGFAHQDVSCPPVPSLKDCPSSELTSAR